MAAGRRFADDAGFSEPVDEFYARIARQGTMGLQPIVVIVDDGNGYRSMYVHLSQALVKVGDQVTRRTVIGLEGDTGNASGCHVHYELIRMDGRWMRVARPARQGIRLPGVAARAGRPAAGAEPQGEAIGPVRARHPPPEAAGQPAARSLAREPSPTADSVARPSRRHP